MVSKEMERIINLLKQMTQSTELSVELTRKGLEQLATMSKVSKDVRCEPIIIDGISAEWISVPESINDHVLFYLHGGGYIAGSINSHRSLCIGIARASKTRVLTIDYRLSPENKFPAAVEDSTASYRWLISSEKILPENIVIAGDSAGGGLALITLIKLRDDNIALPAAAVCLSPWTDLALTGESIQNKADVDPFISPDNIKFMAETYVKDEDCTNPLISPLYADLKGLPPILIQVGTAECLLDDSVRFADRAKSSGVDVSLELWEDMIHVFQAFAAFAPESREGIEKIGIFIRKHLNL